MYRWHLHPNMSDIHGDLCKPPNLVMSQSTIYIYILQKTKSNPGLMEEKVLGHRNLAATDLLIDLAHVL